MVTILKSLGNNGREFTAEVTKEGKFYHAKSYMDHLDNLKARD